MPLNLNAFSTYCSVKKDWDNRELPAMRRYRSSRIAAIFAAASDLGLAFYIVSGKYGLISPHEPIPYYDHLLQLEEVSSLAEHMSHQILAYNLRSLAYFTFSPARDDNLLPYHNALEMGCRLAGIPYLIIELDDNFLHSLGDSKYD